MRVRWVIGLLGLVLLHAHGLAQEAPQVDERKLRAAFKPVLKNWDSALFRAIRQSPVKPPGVWNICGDVITKNSDGSYTAFQPFVGAGGKEAGWPLDYMIVGVGPAAGDVCRAEGLR